MQTIKKKGWENCTLELTQLRMVLQVQRQGGGGGAQGSAEELLTRAESSHGLGLMEGGNNVVWLKHLA